MRILFVASYNKGYFAPFIVEQADLLKYNGHIVDFFGVSGKGLFGYFGQRKELMYKIKQFHPDIIHAHYGLSGLLANLQCKIPVVTTYHGSDINEKKILPFSKISMFLSSYNIFVSNSILKIAKPHKNYSLLPCGVNLDTFKHRDKYDARRTLGLDEDKKIVLFAGAFDNSVKNATLAKNVMTLLPCVTLIECKGYTREQMSYLMNAVDALLMTSFSEGSPQVVKEAMACGCPIVSVDVGDVCNLVYDVDGCYISKSRNPETIALLVNNAISYSNRTNGRERLLTLGLDNYMIVQSLISIYEKVVKH